jgi:pimeloyl-ACP methyl ester carboxylesterase
MRSELASANPVWDAAEVDRRLQDLAACDSGGVAAALRRTTAFDLIAMASCVRIPTLVVVGLESRGSALVGPDRAALVDRLAGDAVFEVLDEGHNLHRDAFPLFMDAFDRWLDATAGVRER